MNAERLLKLYDRVSEAPDAIPRLREFVLDLAVRGKLVEQNSSDEPASDLLKKIELERSEYLKGINKRQTSRRLVVPLQDLPFHVPRSWEWSCLGNVLLKITDGTHHSPPNTQTGDFLYITAKNIKEDGVSLENVTYVARDVHEAIFSRCDPTKGDVLYIKDGATTGIATVNNLDEPFSMLSSVALLKVPASLSNRLLVTFLRSPFFYEQMRGFMKGAAITRVTLKRMAPALLPIPPLPEQSRIVAKVDELMTLCDSLEAEREKRETTRDRLTTASLSRLTAPDVDEKQFKAHADFAIRVLPELTTRPDQIKVLRQTILDLAVRGKLVEQDPNDEPASELLRQIAAEKESLKRQTGDSRIRLATEATVEDYPCELPQGWEVQSFENLFLFIDYRGKTPPKTADGVPLITAKNVRMGVLNREPREFIAAPTYHAWMVRGFPRLDDLLFTTEAPLANVCINNLEEPFALAQRVICLRPYGGINTRFIMFALMSNMIQSLIETHATGMTAKGIKAAKLKPLPLPMPPLDEQRRIVEKIDELMNELEHLEEALRSERLVREGLLSTSLKKVLSRATVQAA